MTSIGSGAGGGVGLCHRRAVGRGRAGVPIGVGSVYPVTKLQHLV